MTKSDDINLVPFSDEELKKMQSTIVSRMIELNHPRGMEEYASKHELDSEIQLLGSIVEKVSKRCKHQQ